MTIEIRLAAPSDVAGMFHVRTSVGENAMTLDEMAEIGITKASISERILNASCAWIAEEEGQIVGFSMIDLDEGSLFAAFVLPSHEGNGIGKMLVQAAERALFKRHTLAWLETGKTTRAADFYRHLGWGNEKDIGGGDIRLEKRHI